MAQVLQKGLDHGSGSWELFPAPQLGPADLTATPGARGQKQTKQEPATPGPVSPKPGGDLTYDLPVHLGGGRNEGAPLCGNLPLQRGLGPWRAAGFPPWLSSCFVPELFSPGTRPTITQLALGTGGTLPCPGRRCTFRKIQTTCIKRPLQTLPSSCILPCTLGNASSTWEGNDTAVNG